MRKLFWDDPYQTSLHTRVAAMDDGRILLDETIAFSFSGGQESDAATLNGVPVLDSVIDNHLIYYSVQDSSQFRVGDSVHMEIDWTRRHRLMRLHFAAELVLEIVTQQYGLEKIGAHIAESKARIDFVCDHNISTIFDELQKNYEQIIQRDLPIKTGFTDMASQRRYWEIEGFARVACGGTHVRSTSEVGLVGFKRKNIGSSKERIEIALMQP